MAHGILILGLNGCGKTTVGCMVAKRLGFLPIDAEDYYFPISGDFTQSRTKEEAHRLMEKEAASCNGFVLSCVRCNISETLLQQVRLAIVLSLSTDKRIQRILEREQRRFGHRVLPGGDLYEAEQAFRAFAALRSDEEVIRSLSRLTCPVLQLDASASPAAIAEQICQRAFLL